MFNRRDLLRDLEVVTLDAHTVQGSWNLVQMYPRQVLPAAGATVAAASLAPQAMLAVEQTSAGAGDPAGV